VIRRGHAEVPRRTGRLSHRGHCLRAAILRPSCSVPLLRLLPPVWCMHASAPPGFVAKLESLTSAIRKAPRRHLNFRESEFGRSSRSRRRSGAAVNAAVAIWSAAGERARRSTGSSLAPMKCRVRRAERRTSIAACFSDLLKPYIAHGSMGPSCGVALWQHGRVPCDPCQGIFRSAPWSRRASPQRDVIDVHTCRSGN